MPHMTMIVAFKPKFEPVKIDKKFKVLVKGRDIWKFLNASRSLEYAWFDNGSLMKNSCPKWSTIYIYYFASREQLFILLVKTFSFQ